MTLSLSPDQRKALVQHYLENAWNTSADERSDPSHCTKDAEAIHPYADTVELYLGGERLDVSPLDIRKKMYATFPDLHFIIVDMLVEGEKVVVRWLIEGTDLGGYDGNPPTGRPMCLTGITLLYMEGQKITEEWNEADIAGMERQLGFVSISQSPKITMRRPRPSRPALF